MSELIEWANFNNSNSSSGSIGEPKIALVEKIHPEHELYRVIVLGCLFGELSSTLEAAKAKAEELLAAWLKEAGLIVKPVKCDKCGGSGKLPEYLGCVDCGHCTVDNMLEAEFCNPTCPCTKDPHSLFNFIKNGE